MAKSFSDRWMRARIALSLAEWRVSMLVGGMWMEMVNSAVVRVNFFGVNIAFIVVF